MITSTDELKSSVKNFIASASFSDISKLKDDTLIFREGFFDSMGFMSLITFLEDTHKISIQDSDLVEDNFESVNAIAKFVLKKEAVS